MQNKFLLCCQSKKKNAFVNLFFAEFLTTWVHVEIIMFDSRMVISSIF